MGAPEDASVVPEPIWLLAWTLSRSVLSRIVATTAFATRTATINRSLCFALDGFNHQELYKQGSFPPVLCTFVFPGSSQHLPTYVVASSLVVLSARRPCLEFCLFRFA